MTAPTSFFVTDGDDYVPTSLGRGPWGPSLAGNYKSRRALQIGFQCRWKLHDHREELTPRALLIVIEPYRFGPLAIPLASRHGDDPMESHCARVIRRPSLRLQNSLVVNFRV